MGFGGEVLSALVARKLQQLTKTMSARDPWYSVESVSAVHVPCTKLASARQISAEVSVGISIQ